MTKHINIDELLQGVEDYQTSGSGKVIHKVDYNLLKQQLYDLVLEIIGEDEEKDRAYSADILKKEQRQKLNNLFKGDNE